MVSIACALTGHRASERTIRNGGRHFASCTRCRADLVETQGRWTTAPAGFRIVWKSVREEPVSPPSQDEALPPLLLDDPVPEEEVPGMELQEEVLREPLPAFLQKRTASDRAGGLPDERRRVERRVNRYAVAYTGIERRRSRDRRTNFGKKAGEAEA